MPGDACKVSFSVSKAPALASARNLSLAEVESLKAQLQEVADHNQTLERELRDFSGILKVATEDNEALRVRRTQATLRQSNHELNFLKQSLQARESVFLQTSMLQNKVAMYEWKLKTAENAQRELTVELERERQIQLQLEMRIRELECVKNPAEPEPNPARNEESSPKVSEIKEGERSVESGRKRAREVICACPGGANEDKPKRLKPVSKQRKGNNH